MDLRKLACRSLYAAPVAFDGELEELVLRHIQQVLPPATAVEYLHHALLNYCRQPDPLFIVRAVQPLERGTIYITNDGSRLKPSDNAPAWWMHFLAFNEIRDVNLSDMPTHMFQVGKVLPTSINAAGWHVAHILDAKNRDTDWRNWSRQELVRRFIRNVHPCNTFYIPTCGWQRYGGDAGVIGFFADVYAKRYASVWEEFLSAAVGAHPVPAPIPRYTYAPQSPRALAPPGSPSESAIVAPLEAAAYSHRRLCFRADVIEPLGMEDAFQVSTDHGVFRITKREFYRDFANVVASRSYHEGGIYHYPRLPQKALKYRIQ